MIKRWMVWLVALLGVLLVAACGGGAVTTAPAATRSAPATTARPTVAVPPTAQGDLNGYTNVRYTEADGDLIGLTNRAQLLNVYATW